MQEKGLYTVVVADDEDELREALCRMIPWEKLGFRLVGEAGNGLDALELVEKLEPDLLLTDIRMPFISGIELARQVREIRPFMHIAFLSGYDDFEYAKLAIQYNIVSYMLKPLTMEGMEQELLRIRERMDTQFQTFREQTILQAERENFLIPLLLDEYPEGAASEEQMADYAAQCSLLQSADDRPRYVVVITCILEPSGDSCTTPSTVHAVNMIAEKYFRYASFFAVGKVVTLLMGNASDFEEYLHILTNELIQMSERVMHRLCNVGVSRETASLTRLHGAYREAVEASSYSRPGQSNIRFLSDMQPMTEAHADSMTTMVSRVENAVKSGAREELERGLEQMITMSHTEQYGKNWLDMTSLQLVSEIYRVLYSAVGGEALTGLQNRGLLPNVGFQYRPAAELHEDLLEFCTCAMELLSSQQKKGSDLLCQQALEAIEQNYMDESFSLASLSGMLNVSPNHLSGCIKKYAGETFINILIKKRMDAARELLLTTPMKILEIAQQCGYSDQHYFSYCFKKYCGITPNMLRRQSPADQNGGAR